MASIVYISKYPPLEGGIAAKTYWLADALACHGHTVHVVTERADVDKLYTIPGISSIPTHPNVRIHRSQQDVPWHIPEDRHRALGLFDTALAVTEEVKPDIVLAGYLVPYGLVASMTGQITGTPYVLLHGGSDVRKFLKEGIWPRLWSNALAHAQCVVTDQNHLKLIERWTPRIAVAPPYVPDPTRFAPMGQGREKRGRPVLALIGKANYYWRHKGWHRVIDLWSHVPEEFDLLAVTQGLGFEGFRNYAQSRLGDRVKWRPFVAPWDMPNLFGSIDALFHFEGDLPFPVFSNLAVEALFCGTSLVLDRRDFIQKYERFGVDLGARANLVMLASMEDMHRAADNVAEFLSRGREPLEPLTGVDFDRYILSIESHLVRTGIG